MNDDARDKNQESISRHAGMALAHELALQTLIAMQPQPELFAEVFAESSTTMIDAMLEAGADAQAVEGMRASTELLLGIATARVAQKTVQS